MAQKKIIWTETAARQRKSILEYWLRRNQSNEYPLKLLRLSNEKANQIAANPMLYKAADFPNMWVAAMGHFSLFYRITGTRSKSRPSRPQRSGTIFLLTKHAIRLTTI